MKLIYRALMNGKNTVAAVRSGGKFLFVMTAALALAACPALTGGEDEYDDNETTKNGDWNDDDVRDRQYFWAQDLTNANKPYRLEADLLMESEHCKIWAERSEKSLVSVAIALNMANEYETTIYPRMIETFSIRNFQVPSQSGGGGGSNR
ncbi:MAG: hypothetical protein LBJ86_03960 [Spirochaetaceae bacterium]|jgi:hypothetical protein|nr:hypothetical protein [Spirochaetaceae bacterium]